MPGKEGENAQKNKEFLEKRGKKQGTLKNLASRKHGKAAIYNNIARDIKSQRFFCDFFGDFLAIFLRFLPRGPCDRKNSIPIENFNPGSKFSILDRKFQSRSKNSIPELLLRGTPGVQRRARSKISIHDRSLELFNPEGRDRIFSIPGPCKTCDSALCDFLRLQFFVGKV